uniref:Uncharacterized protein n=1 Tax=viral metagenome TaxID=1070528 RepID=A0A6C0CX20_9ZZZZ
MGIREYDFEDPPNMNIRNVSNKVEQIIRSDDYNEFVKCLFSMFCILYIILITGFAVLIYSLFHD